MSERTPYDGQPYYCATCGCAAYQIVEVHGEENARKLTACLETKEAASRPRRPLIEDTWRPAPSRPLLRSPVLMSGRRQRATVASGRAPMMCFVVSAVVAAIISLGFAYNFYWKGYTTGYKDGLAYGKEKLDEYHEYTIKNLRSLGVKR